MGSFRSQGYLFGVLLKGDPTIWRSFFGDPCYRDLPLPRKAPVFLFFLGGGGVVTFMREP